MPFIYDESGHAVEYFTDDPYRVCSPETAEAMVEWANNLSRETATRLGKAGRMKGYDAPISAIATRGKAV